MVFVYEGVHTTTHMWRADDIFVESLLSCLYMSSQIKLSSSGLWPALLPAEPSRQRGHLRGVIYNIFISQTSIHGSKNLVQNSHSDRYRVSPVGGVVAQMTQGTRKGGSVRYSRVTFKTQNLEDVMGVSEEG